MPAAEIELDNRQESFDIIVNSGNVEEHFGMTHEAVTGERKWSR